ncbi:MAG TPA: universal stress protein [Thermoplasmata archaeon]|nr:universal stress protein [Thermoplasmata archaeon]
MTEPHLSRILAAVDGSAPSEKALRLAGRIARALGAELMLLHVGPLREHPILLADEEIAAADGEGRAMLAKGVTIAAELGVEARTEIVQGRPAEQILRYARRYRPAVIVMGTRGLTGPKRLLLGSVSREVSEGAECSVLLAR